MHDLRILHAPTTVGGNPVSLSNAEKKLGFISHSLAIEQNYFQYPVDEVLTNSNDNILSVEYKKYVAAKKAIKKYDVFHYNYGQSLSPFKIEPRSNTYPRWKILLYTYIYGNIYQLWDVKQAYKSGKVVAVTFQGDDARLGSYCRDNYKIHFAHEIDDKYYDCKNEEYKSERIRIFNKFTDLMYAVNPDLLNTLPKKAKYLAYANVDPRRIKPVWKEISQDVITISHAPTNRLIKGTKYINEAIERLIREGYKIKYQLIENIDNNTAKDILSESNIVIDQLLAGFYGGLAVEAMALGKPVICYIRETDLHHLPKNMAVELPIINAEPDNIYTVLKKYLTIKKNELAKIGKKSREYVEKWHDPMRIAKQVTNDYIEVYRSKQ